MNSFINRLCSLGWVVLVISACGGGGGGGSGKPTTITVIDGYIQGAIVCVDKNKNDSCDMGETQGKTDSDGKVTLDIPADDAGKFPIVAYVPATAIDKDDGKPVGTEYTMKAPADQTAKQTAIVSPLTTLVQHLVAHGGKSSAEATLQIKNTVGDPAVDYIADPEAKKTRAIAQILAKLMQDLPKSMPMVYAQSGVQKNETTNNILVNALPDLQEKAKLIINSDACKTNMASTECQSKILATANKDLLNYSLVRNQTTGGNYDKTECVNDNITGLIWEGKTSSGPRSGDTTYTNYTSTSIPQKEVGSSLSQSDIDAETNSIGYVRYVNSQSLCGFKDWRLPTLSELKTLVKAGVKPSIDTTWFPDTAQGVNFYWASDSGISIEDFDAGAKIRTTDGVESFAFRSDKDRIRLVRSDTSQAGSATSVDKGGVTQTATITSVKDGDKTLQNGDTANSQQLTLQGSYQGTLDPGYSVEVFVDGMNWDRASIDPVKKTWTSTKHMPWYGSLKIQVAVRRYEQVGPFPSIYNEYFGKYSDVFNVKIGNNLSQNNNPLSTWDEWVLTVSQVWRNVRSVVVTFVTELSDMVDGLVTRTLNNINPGNREPLSISSGFKTTGDKKVNIEYLGVNGQQIATDSIQLKVTAVGSVAQIPTIEAVTDISNKPIPKDASTSDTVLTVDGSLSAAIGKFYSVEVYDSGSNTAIPGAMRYNTDRTKWTFTPSATLSTGSHALTAAVVRVDSVSGARSKAAWNFTLTQPRLIKIGANGTALANQNAQWSDTGNEADGTRWDCILESDTGRMWEAKPKTPNQLRNADATFTYYIPNPRVSGSWVGLETTNGSCNSLPSGKKCNTQNYIEAVNSVGLCGKKDWRLPTQTDVDQQMKGFPKLYFPNLTWFWVESDNKTYGWYVEAYSTVNNEVGPVTYGTDDASEDYPVILVRNSPPN